MKVIVQHFIGVLIHFVPMQCGNGMWFEFDDEKVFPVSKDRIKTSAAYVLFYRRVPDV